MITNLKNVLCSTFCIVFFTLFIVSGVHVLALDPVIDNPIANQTAHTGDWFEMTMDTYSTFSDPDGDGLTATVTQADDSELPSWLDEQAFLAPSVVATLNTGAPSSGGRVSVSGDYVYVPGSNWGLKIVDISDPTSPIEVGTYDTPGYAYGVELLGNYAYVADDDYGLQIIDVSTPSSPSLVGSLDTSGNAYDVTVVGNYAYVADYLDGLQIIDITTPSSPSLVGTYNTSGWALGVYVVGSYAYVAGGYSGLQIIDVSTPSSPSLVGTYDTPGTARGVTVSGDYAYVADASSGLMIIDVSTPSSLSLVGTYNTTGCAKGVVVVGNFAYLAEGECLIGEIPGVRIVDVSNPASPFLAGTCTTSTDLSGLAVRGNYAYGVGYGGVEYGFQIVGGVGGGIKLSGSPSSSDAGELNLKVTASDGSGEVSEPFSIDISNDAPVVMNPIANQTVRWGDSFDMSIDTYYTFNDPDNEALDVVVKQENDSDLPAWITEGSISLSPTLVGTYDTSDNANGVAVVDNYAYVADYTGDLQIVDITDPASPSLAGSLDTPGEALDVDVVGNYAYVADNASGLQIVDVSDPATPTIVGACVTSNAKRIVVLGSYAYIADGDSGLRIIDVSTPSSPALIGTCDTSHAMGVAVKGNYAYVGDHDSGLRVIDISNPASPTLVATDTFGGVDTARGVSIFGNYAYVADGNVGLRVVDVGNPASPSLVGTYYSPGYGQDVIAFENYAYLADYDAGLRIVDISNPSGPFSVGSLDTSGEAYGIFVKENYAYIADGGAGLKIISGVGEGITLSGTPSDSDIGLLNLKATASDGSDSVSDLFYIDVINDPPVVSNVAKSGLEDQELTFSALDFENHFNDTEGSNLAKIQVVTLPENGDLELSSASVALNQEIDAVDLGDLTFIPDADWYGDTTFEWLGSDGHDYSLSTADVNIAIQSVDDNDDDSDDVDDDDSDDSNDDDIIDDDSAASTYSKWWKFGF